jgi:serine phosphatase RsbU (regulator of sigma subunit)
VPEEEAGRHGTSDTVDAERPKCEALIGHTVRCAMRDAAVMTDSSSPPAGMLRAARELPPWLVPAYVRLRAAEAGASEVALLLQDYDQRMLLPLTDESAAEAATGATTIEGTLAGRAYMSGHVVEVAEEKVVRLWLPLVDGGDRLGVLALTVPALKEEQRERWEEFSALVAALLVSKGKHTDVYFRARRRQDMTLAAEMQWQLLPPLSVTDPRVAVGGVVEPAYAVGGDAFDYAINHQTAHIAVFDAMGHGLDAAVMSTVAVGAYRHGRRLGAPVTDLYTLVDAEFSRQFGDGKFATAQFATLDLPSGRLALVNAGHPPPLHIRGRRVLSEISGATTLPVGLAGATPDVITADLEPGDRLLLYTDGVVDARRDGVTYDEAGLVSDLEHVLGDELPVPEVVRRLNIRCADWRGGGPPNDDATMVLVEWRSRELPPL